MMAEDHTHPGRPTGVMLKLRALMADRSGIGAVEFALLAPLLLCLYLMAFQLTLGLGMAKRTTRSAAAIADLVAQQDTATPVTPTMLAGMTNVVGSMFAPYSANNLKLKITGITIDASGNATVAWSRDVVSSARAYAVGSSVSVPSDLRTPSTFLIHAEVSTDFVLLPFSANLLPTSAQTLTIYRHYFYRLRTGASLSCNGC